MAKPLLDRQSSLLRYLTSGAAIFDENEPHTVDPVLRGLDLRLLAIEARFSFEKRIAKISAVFPRTLALLGEEQEKLFREFVEGHPPVDIGRLENARQFSDFLGARWRRQPAQPSYLPDVSACELAFATARALAQDSFADPEMSSTPRTEPELRRSPAVVLLRCAHDIRPLFEQGSGAEEPPLAREVGLAILARASADAPQIFDLAPPVFELLGSLDDWVNMAPFQACEDASKLMRDLARAGLIEIRP